MVVARRKLTLEEFLKLPEEEPALEYEDGEVTQKMSPMGQHAMLQLRLGAQIQRIADRKKRALVFTELRATFAGISRVPDIAVYQWGRYPRDENGELANIVTEPPDIAIEIVSPGQTVTSQMRRCLRFVELGVGLALVVNPSERSVLAFRPGEPTQAWRGKEQIDLSPLLPDFNLTVEKLFNTESVSSRSSMLSWATSERGCAAG